MIQQKPAPGYERALALYQKTKSYDVFEYEGCLYMGDAATACREFCDSTTYPADFHVWLQQHYKQLEDKS